MTSWRYVSRLSLLVFLSMIDPSEEACYDNFEREDWTEYPTNDVTIINAKDSKDTVECTAERECQQRDGIACELLFNCYNRTDNKTSEKCQMEKSSSSVPYYQFMCFAAISLNYRPEGFVQATTLSQTTTLPETTTATVAALPSTAPTPTPTVTQSAVNGGDGQPSERKEDKNKDTDTLKLKLLLMASGILNLLLLAVFLYMCHQQTQSRTQWNLTHVSTGNPPRDQPMTELKSDTPLPSVNVDVETTTLIQSDTQLPSVNVDVETTTLIQPSECLSILTHEADVIGKSCAVGEGTQH